MQSAGADSAELAGSSVGPYAIVRALGEGGFGSVWLAEQSQPVRRLVALKILRAGLDSEQIVRRFEAERQALALMDHPCIARVYDAGTAPSGRPYIAMEYVAGAPITEFCDAEQLSTAQRLALFQEVCRGVQHAHQKGVAHRDIKPSNVLVLRVDGVPLPKIIDFGVAKALDVRLSEQTLVTEALQILGTPEYMAPEQAEGRTDVDTRADVYSLGVLLYELLTGSKPFELRGVLGLGIGELLRHISEVDPPRPSTRVSTVGARGTDVAKLRGVTQHKLSRALRGDLDWIVLRAIEKDRERRYPSASELADDVGRFLAHEPVEAGPPSAAYRLRKFARRNRGLVAAAGAVAASLAVGVVALAWGFVEVRRERDAAETARGREVLARGDAEDARDEAETARAELELALGREGEARASAESSLAEAEEVTDFLTDMLASIDPRRDGLDVTVRALLDRSALDVGTRFADEPEVEQRLRETIGSAYLSLGLADRAEEHVLAALELARRGPDPGGESLHYALRTLASLRLGQGRLDEAHEDLEEALELRCAQEDEGLRAEALSQLGYVENGQGHYGEAERLYRESLPVLRAVHGPEHRMTLVCLTNLQALLWNRRRYEEAAPIGAELLELYLARYGPDHPDTLVARYNQARGLEHVGRLEEAEAEFRAVLETRRRVLGAENPGTIAALSALGDHLRERARFVEAEESLRAALDLAYKVFGAGHPQTIKALRDLALCATQAGRPREAEPLLVEAVEAAVQTFGPTNPATLDARNLLAIVRLDLGRLDEAGAAWEELVLLQRELHGAESIDAVRAQVNLGIVREKQGRLAEAEILYRESLAILRSTSGPDDTNMQSLLNNLGSLYLSMDRPVEARALLVEVVEIRTRLLGPEHPLTLDSLEGLAAADQKEGRLDEAQARFEALLASRRSALGEVHPSVGQTLLNLGVVASKRGDYQAALARYREALDVYVAVLGEESAQTADMRRRIGNALRSLGRLDEAEQEFRRTFEVRGALFGPEHALTVAARDDLAQALRDLGRTDDALRLDLDGEIERLRKRTERRSAKPEHFDELAKLLLLRDPRDPAEVLEAVELARRANEAAEYARPELLLTLARALRASGDEPAALAAAQQVWDLFSPEERAGREPRQLIED